MFNSARLKLTAWYLLIIMLVSGTFSLVIFEVQTNELDRFVAAQRVRFERRYIDLGPRPLLLDPALVEEYKSRLVLTLLFINGGILVISGATGFFLAGRTLKPIKEMMDDQNRFISDASHELRTPLTSLKSSIEVSLRDKNLNLKDAKDLLTSGLGEVNKLQNLSEGLLQLAQYQLPTKQNSIEKVSIDELIKESIRKVSPLAKQKNITISTEIQKNDLEGNKYSLTELFIILLDNAIKYSPENSTVTISSKRKDGTVMIAVTDQGIGIEPEALPHIFDRFYRADTARSKTTSGGFGVGLSIAKKIVEQHNGEIRVESKPKKGSTFLLILPTKTKKLIS